MQTAVRKIEAMRTQKDIVRRGSNWVEYQQGGRGHCRSSAIFLISNVTGKFPFGIDVITTLLEANKTGGL